MSEWREVTLGELVRRADGFIRTGPFGSQLHQADYTDDPLGVPVIMPKDMTDSRVDTSSISRIDEEVARRLGAHRLVPGDIVLARRGDVGRFAFIEPDEEGWLCGTGSMRVHAPNHSVVVPRFLRYAMAHPGVADWFIGQAVGATMPNLNAAIVEELPLHIPDAETQSAVAAILSGFDELIEINERRIELLENLARSLYREWFVRFRFPGHEDVECVESELGRVPQSCEVVGLFDAADVGFGFSFKSPQFVEAGPFPVVRIRDVPKGITRTFTDEEAPDRYRVADGDLLIGMDGEFHMKLWSGGDAWLNQRVARLRPLPGLAACFLMLAVERPLKDWNSAIVGTTVAHLGKQHLEQIRLVLPPIELREDVKQHFDALAGEALALRKENSALAATRDLLLPRFVTGRLDISDIKRGQLLPSESA